MIKDLKVSYIKDRDMKVTLTPAIEGADFIDHCHLAAIFAQVVRDCFIDARDFLELLANNLDHQVEIKEEEQKRNELLAKLKSYE